VEGGKGRLCDSGQHTRGQWIKKEWSGGIGGVGGGGVLAASPPVCCWEPVEGSTEEPLKPVRLRHAEYCGENVTQSGETNSYRGREDYLVQGPGEFILQSWQMAMNHWCMKYTHVLTLTEQGFFTAGVTSLRTR